MSNRKRIPQANQSGFTLSGILKNAAWINLPNLTGWTAKVSLLTLPSFAVAAELNRQTATLNLAAFNPTTGEVPVSFALSGLTTSVPLGEYRGRWILIDPNGKELGGPPSSEATNYVFEP